MNGTLLGGGHSSRSVGRTFRGAYIHPKGRIKKNNSNICIYEKKIVILQRKIVLTMRKVFIFVSLIFVLAGCRQGGEAGRITAHANPIMPVRMAGDTTHVFLTDYVPALFGDESMAGLAVDDG